MKDLKRYFLFSSLVLTLVSQNFAFQNGGWRISPESINTDVGTERTLQVLDDSAQELLGAEWSVNDPTLATVREEGGRLILSGMKAGTVRVTAALHGERRYSDITIWSAERPAAPGSVRWGMHPIGREINDIAAVPTPDGPNMLSLEQTRSGDTYLRGTREDGIQIWAWHLPEATTAVELVCGDWIGGALISANRAADYTLYNVGNDGTLRWKYTLPGSRKGHAYTLDHVVYILSQSNDGVSTTVTAIAEDGNQKFQLTVPQSHERTNVGRASGDFHCMSKEASAPIRTVASRLFVSVDGFGYLAFTKNEWAVLSRSCSSGTTVDKGDVIFARQDRIVLWQIHPEGTYRETVLEESTMNNPVLNVAEVPSPTGAIIPDGFDGVLLSVRRPLNSPDQKTPRAPAEFVYRIDGNGKVVYRSLLPSRDGELHDEMVLGENNIGFATRGALLIAFHVQDGSEAWRWDSGTPGIEVFAALADGSCLVQTPKALVDVFGAAEAREVFEGKAVADWRGQIYRKHE